MNLLLGDCLEKLKELEDNSVDAIVTDPPYGLSFMGKKWDYDVPSVDIWKECLRVLKHGGYLLSFAGTRTQHRMAVNIEDAGFEIRDMIMYVYGSGFPKSLNIFKQLKKRCTCGNMEAYEQGGNVQGVSSEQEAKHSMRPVSEADLSQTVSNQKTEGKVLQQSLSEQSLPTSLLQLPSKVRKGQPSLEGGSNIQESKGELQGSDISEVSKGISADGEERWIHNAAQISNGSTLEQITNENGGSTSPRPQSQQQQYREPCAFCKQYGTQAMGALGLGSALKPACEPITVARKPISEKNLADNHLKWGVGGINIDGCRVETEELKPYKFGFQKGSFNDDGWKGKNVDELQPAPSGRFPANLIHDGSEEVVGLFPQTKSGKMGPQHTRHTDGSPNGIYGKFDINHELGETYGDSGSVARFFYCAKASKRERNIGCEGLEEKIVNDGREKDIDNAYQRGITLRKNTHPTVKPIALMEYLVKMVSREGQVVLDPFMGSGTTGMACKKLNRDFIGIEMMPEYMEIAKCRIEATKKEDQLNML